MLSRKQIEVGDEFGQARGPQLRFEPLVVEEQLYEIFCTVGLSEMPGQLLKEVPVVVATSESGGAPARVGIHEFTMAPRQLIANALLDVHSLQVVQSQGPIVIAGRQRARNQLAKQTPKSCPGKPMLAPEHLECRLGDGGVLGEDAQVEVPLPLALIHRVDAHFDRRENARIAVVRESRFEVG